MQHNPDIYPVDGSEAPALRPNSLPAHKIKRALDLHSIPGWFGPDDRIFADAMIASEPDEVIELTGSTLGELRDWLGY